MTSSRRPVVVFATPHDPGDSSGAGIVVRGRLQAITKLGAAVHLVREGRAAASLAPEPGLYESGEAVRRGGQSAASIASAVASLVTRGFVPKWSPRTFDALATAVERLEPDAVVLDDLRLASHGRRLRKAGFSGRIVLHEHNVEHVLLSRQRDFTTKVGKRLELSHRIRRFRAMESELARDVDACVTLTDDDRALLSGANAGFDVRWIPPHVDLERYRAQGEGEPGELLFIGSLTWAPNLDGVEWFVKEIWPLVKSQVAEAQLTVVGRAPPDWLKAFGGAVHAPGFVDDDRVAYEKARVVLVPLRFGSGVRIKILTALAMRRAVVSTRLGAEGIPLKQGESVILADEPAAFAQGVVELLRDASRAKAMAGAGHEVCRSHYSLDAVSKALSDVLFGASRVD